MMFSFMMMLLLQMAKGRKLTAKDVEYSLSRIIDKQTASPGVLDIQSESGFAATIQSN